MMPETPPPDKYSQFAERTVRWPGSYDEVLTSDRLSQGDIIRGVCFTNLNVNPTALNKSGDQLIIESNDFEILPAIILNQDCDCQHDRLLQLIALRDVNSDRFKELYPCFASKNQDKKDRFRSYCKSLRQYRDKINQFWLPPHTKGVPFDKYKCVDHSQIATIDFTNQRNWAEENRIGRLSKEMMSDLLSFINYRYTRVGKNDYFWLGPLDAMAKYTIELVDEIEKQQALVDRAIEKYGEGDFVESFKNDLNRLQSERERLYEQLIKNITKDQLDQFYHLFIENHPDKENGAFNSKYLLPINPIWKAITSDELPWNKPGGQRLIARE